MAKVFFSYSHEDEELRNKLAKHLSLLMRQGLVESWHDRKILGGDVIDDKVFTELDQADVILLLVSADFIHSEYCFGREMARAMERHEAKQARVVPVIVRPCDWHGAPFGKLMGLPRDGRPITSWANNDEAMLDVATQVRRIVDDMNRQAREVDKASVKAHGNTSTGSGQPTPVAPSSAVPSVSAGKRVPALSTDILADAGDEARRMLTAAYNRLEVARITEQPMSISLTSALRDQLMERAKEIAANRLPDDLGQTELSLTKENQRLEKLAAPLTAIATEPSISSWLESVDDRVQLALDFIEILANPSAHRADGTTFDLVLLPKHDVSFTFVIPDEFVALLMKRNGFDKIEDGERMLNANYGFDIFDLPLELVRSEVLPRLLRFVYVGMESLKGKYSNEELLNLRRWTFGLH